MEQSTMNFAAAKSEDLVLWYQNREMLNDDARSLVERELEKRSIALDSIPLQQNLTPARPVPMAWFNFWRWVVLPMFALRAVADLAFNLNDSTAVDRLTSAGVIIAVAILMFLLEKRHIYGWWLNWVFIFAFALAGLFPNIVNENDEPVEMDFATTATIKAIVLLIFIFAWLRPNWIYFNKRRHIFTKQEIASPPYGE